MFFSSKKIEKERRYFDYAAATPIDSEVLSLLCSLLSENFANPGALYSEGTESKDLIEKSRLSISEMISAHKDEIVFTSGGTESDVLAIRGVIKKVSLDEKFEGKPHVVISAIEHSAIFDTVHELEKEGQIELSILPVNKEGRVAVEDLKDVVKKTTVLISIMYINNEIGVIQDIPTISKEVRRLKKKLHGDRHSYYPLIHTDASQAFGFAPIGVSSLGIDLMSFNSGKVYGPKGVGALFVKRGVALNSIFYSGGQESGLRPGTEPVALIASFARALEISEGSKSKESLRIANLREYFLEKLEKIIKESCFKDLDLDYKVNGSQNYNSPHIISLSFKGLESDQMVIELDAKGISVSSKSACKTLDPQVSHVLSAIGYDDNSWGAIRFSFGRDTQNEDIDFAIVALQEVLFKLLHTKKEFLL